MLKIEHRLFDRADIKARVRRFDRLCGGQRFQILDPAESASRPAGQAALAGKVLAHAMRHEVRNGTEALAFGLDGD